ncbi:MAG: type II toxin-antitoxin system RelB/DinJ family antitoxin [Verrucomicrobiota bacterium JB022]|nr:type II toxin-antitoxin system RelB/DinJ family antitoxin [Verrucomicrobiota bacterium JB022]
MPHTIVLHLHVEEARYREAEEVLSRLGLGLSDAIDLFFVEVASRGDLPFTATFPSERLQTDEQLGHTWNHSLGEY